MVLGVIWRKTGKRKEGEKIPKPGTQVEYKGKKYVSLKELSKDINVPYELKRTVTMISDIVGFDVTDIIYKNSKEVFRY